VGVAVVVVGVAVGLVAVGLGDVGVAVGVVGVAVGVVGVVGVALVDCGDGVDVPDDVKMMITTPEPPWPS